MLEARKKMSKRACENENDTDNCRDVLWGPFFSVSMPYKWVGGGWGGGRRYYDLCQHKQNFYGHTAGFFYGR